MTGRFAPTPTGGLHVGNLRTALVSWLAARRAGQPWLIRVEDLDRVRLPQAEAIAAAQLADLAQLGLTSDAPVVRQSDRFDYYAQAVAHLDVYECFCSRKDVAEASQAPHGATPRYPGTCRQLSAAERADRHARRPGCWRVNAHGARVTVADALHGQVCAPVDDFVVRRADGLYAYNLAVVVDDGLQGVDHVVRGDDLLASSPRQAWLASQLGFKPPSYLHVPLVCQRDGTRLAKRQSAIDLNALASQGLTPADVLHRLAWSLGLAQPGQSVDLMDLVDRFDPARLPLTPWRTDPSTWRPDDQVELSFGRRT